MDFITKQNDLNYELLKYKFELIEFHEIDWFKNTRFGWKCNHSKIKIINLYKTIDMDYKNFCLQNGLYSLTSLEKWLNDKTLIVKESEDDNMSEMNKKLIKL